MHRLKTLLLLALASVVPCACTEARLSPAREFSLPAPASSERDAVQRETGYA